MSSFLKNLNARPAHEKRRFSLHAASGIMVAVFMVWISTLGVRLASSGQSGSVTDSGAGGLVAGVVAAGSGLQAQFGQLQSGVGAAEGNGTPNSAPQQPAAAPAVVLQSAPLDASSSSASGAATPASANYLSGN